MRLQDKIIFLTGGNGLLGRAIRQQVIAEGGTCISGDVHLADDMTSESLVCDVTDPKSVSKAVDDIYNKYGHIDGFVNSAYPRTSDWGKKFEDIEISSWKENIDMQLNSVFFLCQEILKRMAKRQQGSVVNIASIYGIVGPDFSVYGESGMTMPAAYSVIKGGVINFTRYLASFYGPYNVRVNCISPGGIFDNQPEAFVKRYEDKVPMRRMGTAEEMASPVCFLLSEEAKYITGHNLVVDGGWTAI